MNANNYVSLDIGKAYALPYGFAIPCGNNINSLDHDEVFVFGSNLAGRHGAGAAKLAHNKFGAQYGYGKGITGQSYAIPTKDKDLRILSLREIKSYVEEFIEYAKLNPNIHFLVTKIGCGLAGYTVIDIAPMFAKARFVQNIHLPLDFLRCLIGL